MAESPSRRKRWDGVIKLPGHLLVTAEVAGWSTATRIGGENVEVLFPTQSGETAPDQDGWLVAPPHPRRGALDVNLAQQTQWGFGSVASGFMVDALRVSFLAPWPATEQPGQGSPAPSISNGIHEWFRFANRWLCAWLRLPYRFPASAANGTLRCSRPDGSRGTYVGMVEVAALPDLPTATVDQVRTAFALAVERRPVPLEHQFLIAARTSSFAGDTRRAVIDAGTAVEVALAAAIKDELTSRFVAAAFQETAVRQANGAVGLLDLYRSLGKESPVSRSQLMDQLAGPRNDAAHAGREPTPIEVSSALAVATRLVEHARPAPSAILGSGG